MKSVKFEMSHIDAVITMVSNGKFLIEFRNEESKWMTLNKLEKLKQTKVVTTDF